jgi:hypothetical protein
MTKTGFARGLIAAILVNMYLISLTFPESKVTNSLEDCEKFSYSKKCELKWVPVYQQDDVNVSKG